MKKSRNVIFAASAAIMAGIALVAAPAAARADCGNGTLVGAYSVLLSGKVGTRQLGAEGQLIADGGGGLTGSLTVNRNANAFTQSLTGSYGVASNCVGTMTINLTGFSPANFSFTLNNGGAGFAAVQTDFATAVTMTGTRF